MCRPSNRAFRSGSAVMKNRCLAWLAVAILSPLVAGTVTEAQPAPQAGTALERHEFVIRDFRTESGVVLPEARVVYSTLGTVNARGDNAILLPSHYMANFNGYNWLIRGADPNRVFDPSRDFLILTELFGNGRS